MAASASRVRAVFDEVSSWPEFLPELQASRVVAAEPGELEIAIALHASRRLEFTVRVVEETLVDGASRLRWSLVTGPFHSADGSLEIHPTPEGARLTWTLELLLGSYVSGCAVNELLRRDLPRVVERFKARAEAGPS